MRQLDDMSNPYRDPKLQDFDRGKVLKAIVPFLDSRDEKQVKTTLQIIGAGSPYLDDNKRKEILSKC
jgi:hypothetical protein